MHLDGSPRSPALEELDHPLRRISAALGGVRRAKFDIAAPADGVRSRWWATVISSLWRAPRGSC